MRQSGRTTRMLLELALYISEHWNEDKKVLLAGHSVRYATDLLMQLCTFFPGAKRFAYTSVTFGRVVVRPFNFSDLKKPKVTHGAHWDAIFRDHYTCLNAIHLDGKGRCEKKKFPIPSLGSRHNGVDCGGSREDNDEWKRHL